MKSSLSEGAVVRGDETATPVLTRELRSGTWTRLGGTGLAGDDVAEHTFGGLVESTQAAARAQGYSVGWAEGRRSAEEKGRAAEQIRAETHAVAEQRREQEHRAAVAALRVATEQLSRATLEICESVADQATRVAMELTETIVGRELASATEPGADAVRRALALMPGEPIVRIRLHPGDLVPGSLSEVQTAGAVLVGDASLATGDAIVETIGSVLDARISTAVERVREVLLP